MAGIRFFTLAALSIAALAVPCIAGEISGDWLTDPEAALAAALKAKKPVLAVAMDHA